MHYYDKKKFKYELVVELSRKLGEEELLFNINNIKQEDLSQGKSFFIS